MFEHLIEDVREGVVAELASALDALAAQDLHALPAGAQLDRIRDLAEARNRLDPDGTEPDPTEGRSLSIATHADGSISGRFELDAVGGEKEKWKDQPLPTTRTLAAGPWGRPYAASSSVTRWCSGPTSPWPPARLRSCAHPRATADRHHPAGGPGLPRYGPGAGRMGLGAGISAGRARWPACDGAITRVVMGPDGQVLDLGRGQRITPPHLRRAVEARDTSCVFAGCSAPHHWCDVHHVLEWVAGQGPTSIENSGLLCERHHTQVHHGFTISRDPSGRWHTYRPDGTELLVPTPLLA